MNRRSCLGSRVPPRDPEAGVTVPELMVASAILMIALAGFFASFASLGQTSTYTAGRQRALDDLRITAGVFAKDARHATEIVDFDFSDGTEVVMETFVQGVTKQVTYQVVADDDDPSKYNLERVELGGSPRLFVIKLTSESIFTTDNLSDPSLIRTIGIHMETQPNEKYPAVVLGTEVALRNADA